MGNHLFVSGLQARVVLYKDVAVLLQITFNAINSDNSNWFSMSRLTDSPWTDLASESKAVFAIRKWTRRRERRSFHISKTFDSCGEDEGWLTVTDPTSCTWEQRKGRGTVVYSNTHRYTNWNSPSTPGTIFSRQHLLVKRRLRHLIVLTSSLYSFQLTHKFFSQNTLA